MWRKHTCTLRGHFWPRRLLLFLRRPPAFVPSFIASQNGGGERKKWLPVHVRAVSPRAGAHWDHRAEARDTAGGPGRYTNTGHGAGTLRWVAQAEIVEVIEIRAHLPAESAHPDVRHGTRLGVSSCCYGAGTTGSRCGVCDARFRGHVCTCLSRCRVCDSSTHRRLRSSSYHKNSGDNGLPNSDSADLDLGKVVHMPGVVSSTGANGPDSAENRRGSRGVTTGEVLESGC